MANPHIQTREQLDAMRDEFNRRWKDSFDKAEADNKALRELINEMADALDVKTISTCFQCESDEQSGHDANCRVGKLLARAASVKP